MSKIAYYISSHGFGHSTRAIEVINHIPRSVDLEIVTHAPQWLFEHSIHRPFRFRDLHHDPGIMQVDSLRNDVERTYECWSRLLDQYPRMADAEAQRISEEGVTLAVGDISPFAVAVAQRAKIPSVVIANFSWDWIFSVFLDQKPAFQHIIDRIAGYYQKTDRLLRTPLAGDLSVFPTLQDVPLIVRRSSQSRAQARAQFGLRLDERVVLISFGGMGLAHIEADYLKPFEEITFLTFDEKLLGPANVRYLHPRKTYHPDAIQAADLALAKLGYGIVTECIAHQTPIAFPPRADFPEHPILEREAARWIPIMPIAANDFFSGKWDFLPGFLAQITSRTISDHRIPPVDGGHFSALILTHIAQNIKIR